MTSKTTFGALTTISALAIVATLAFGCAQPQESQTASAELDQQIAALEQRIGAVEQQLEALGVPDRGVIVKVTGSGKDTKLVRVIPNDKKICKEGMMDCPTEAMWHLSSDLDEGWSIEIREKADSIDKDCFEPPGGADHWTLTSKAQPASSGPSSCDEGAIWEYDVILKEGTTERGRIDPLFFLPFI
jgi:hypothetical protein